MVHQLNAGREAAARAAGVDLHPSSESQDA
jgi:hypothetical protein